MRGPAFLTALFVVSTAHAGEPPPPPTTADSSLAPLSQRSTQAADPLPEPGTLRIRIHGEYELRQSVLSALPLPTAGNGPAYLDQTSRLFHWLRLRTLLLVGQGFELRGEADVPRGMILGGEPQDLPDNGSDFDDRQPVRLHARMLRATLRGQLGEVSVGHGTTHFGLGMVDNDGDQARWFGTPDRPATFEQLRLTSGGTASPLRVFVAGDALYSDGRLSLPGGDLLARLALGAQYTPGPAVQLGVFGRYESLRPRASHDGARSVVFDGAGRLRGRLPDGTGEVWFEYEVAYRLGDVDEATAFASLGGPRESSALAGAARFGVALEGRSKRQRYAFALASLGAGMASADADPSDDELHRFVMNPNHAVGLILFSEALRFKTSRAQALLARASAQAGNARVERLATGGGVAGSSYLNPVLLLRPIPALDLKLGGVVASATGEVVDPSALAARGRRENYDGGSPRGRAIGTELDLGVELRVPLDPPMQLRLSVEGGIAFPGSAFHNAEGQALGTQTISTAGLGLTF